MLAIAKSFAEIGARVLVIDGDLDRSPLSSGNAGGLIELLSGKVDLGVITQTATHGLDLLPAGRSADSNSSALLASKIFDDLLTQLKTTYDQIFIVAPPLLRSAAGVIASDKADGVVLVAKLGTSTVEQVHVTVAAVANIETSVFGVVTSGA